MAVLTLELYSAQSKNRRRDAVQKSAKPENYRSCPHLPILALYTSAQIKKEPFNRVRRSGE